ncbi:MAG: CARDB domain-containing protein [Actinomycetota bacterium]
MDFPDEDPPLATDTRETSSAPPRPRRPRPPRSARQQFLIRRAIAVGGGLLILILLVLGVRGCLDARKERALKDYSRDVAAIVDGAQQVSDNFFGRLEDPGSLSTTEFEAEIASDRGGLDSLFSRTEKLDVPGDMSQAQDAFLQAMELRRDALTEISDRMPTALGSEGREAAIDAITDQMQALLASDVIYRDIAKPEMEDVLQKEGIEGVTIPASKFLPDISWLDSTTVDDALSQVSGAQAAATPGVHGLGLIQVSANGQVLEEGVPVTVSTGGAPELEVQVQNQGESEESGVTLSVAVDGGEPIEQQISTIAPGETQSVAIPLTPAPKGQTTLDVEVNPVPGEQVSDNNSASYDVTFQ